MKALLAITARELRERWTLPLAMFVVGFAPLFLVRYVDVTARPLATIAAVTAVWGIALLMGGSVIARDLADGRLGFFFARPVPWWSIAGGKLLAALVMSVLAPIAGLLPAVVFDWNPAKDAEGLGHLLSGGGLALMLALVLALVSFGHVASVVYRARSTWAGVDFILLGACAWGGVWLFYAFKRLGVVMSGPLATAWQLLLPLLLVAAVPFTAAVVQVAVGRSDLRRGHVALSITFWCGVLVWLAALGGLLLRERALTPAGLASRGITGVSADGRVVGLDEGRPDARAAFLYDTASGRSLRLGLGSLPAFSADGRHAAWVEEAPFWRHDRPAEVQLARLDESGFSTESVELATRLPQESVIGLALSARAERLAVVQSTTLSVYEIPSGRTLSTTAAADGDWMAAAFLKDGELRAFRRVKAALGAPGTGVVPGRIEVVSMSAGVPSSAVRLDAVGHALLISPADEDLVLLHEAGTPRRVTLHDARSGRRVRKFPGEDGATVVDALLLEDGGVAVIEGVRGDSRRLRIAREGQPDQLADDLPVGANLLSSLPQGHLAVGRSILAGDRLQHETLFFSSTTAQPEGREPGLLPAGRWVLGPWRGSRAALLFNSDAGELVRFDPASQERRVLLPAPPAKR